MFKQRKEINHSGRPDPRLCSDASVPMSSLMPTTGQLSLVVRNTALGEKHSLGHSLPVGWLHTICKVSKITVSTSQDCSEDSTGMHRKCRNS